MKSFRLPPCFRWIGPAITLASIALWAIFGIEAMIFPMIAGVIISRLARDPDARIERMIASTPRKKRLMFRIGVGLIFAAYVIVFFFLENDFPRPVYILISVMLIAGVILTSTGRSSGVEMTKVFSQVKSLLFPRAVKWIGFGITAVCGALLPILHNQRLWGAMILGLWIAMWSRSSREDEMMREVRMSAAWFALSFAALLFVFFKAWNPAGNIPTEVGIFIVMLYYHVVLWHFKWRISREKHD